MCSKQLDKGNPYFHFQDTLSPCYNLLFENAGGDFDSDDDFEFSDDDDDDDDDWVWRFTADDNQCYI